MIQEEYHWIKVEKLGGYEPAVVTDSVMSLENWFSGEYQVAKEAYRNNFFGFRNWAVRLNNQVEYSLYSASNADNIVVGQDNYLYGIDYVKAYNGKDFVGEEVVNAKLNRFKQVQDTLSKLGKHIFVIITPNKADYFPDYLPFVDQLDRENVKTNYDYYIKGIKEKGINHIDLNKWFVDIRDTVSYPLFPQTGIHLSFYGSALFADTLIGYIEKVMNKDLPDFIWSNVVMSQEARGADADAEEALNLLFKLPYYKLPYPHIEIKEKGKYKPRALVVGDSFYWRFVNWKGQIKVFNRGHFWYYNKDAHPGNRKVGNLKIGNEIKDKDVIFIVNSSFNLWRFGFGFDMDLYAHFFGEKILANKDILEDIIQEKIKAARKDKKWMKFIKEEAMKKEKPFEEILYKNVAYVVKKELAK